MSTNKRDLTIVALLWVILTVLGEALALNWASALFPLAAAEEASIVDDAFRTLLILAVPVFAFVVAMLVYSVPRFRSRGEPSEDGPPVHTRGPVVATWFVVTTALTIFMILHPGITGLEKIRAEAEKKADLVVQVEGFQWSWRITYPEHNVTASELVLPVGKRVRFEVTATDVIHSFWVPAFRMKVDAVPGLVTTVYATPNRKGTFAEDSTLRVQCAELCGLLHSGMVAPVAVVEERAFEAWLAQQKPSLAQQKRSSY